MHPWRAASSENESILFPYKGIRVVNRVYLDVREMHWFRACRKFAFATYFKILCVTNLFYYFNVALYFARFYEVALAKCGRNLYSNCIWPVNRKKNIRNGTILCVVLVCYLIMHTKMKCAWMYYVNLGALGGCGYICSTTNIRLFTQSHKPHPILFLHNQIPGRPPLL